MIARGPRGGPPPRAAVMPIARPRPGHTRPTHPSTRVASFCGPMARSSVTAPPTRRRQRVDRPRHQPPVAHGAAPARGRRSPTAFAGTRPVSVYAARKEFAWQPAIGAAPQGRTPVLHLRLSYTGALVLSSLLFVQSCAAPWIFESCPLLEPNSRVWASQHVLAQAGTGVHGAQVVQWMHIFPCSGAQCIAF